jgi:hypothetical protein
MSDRITISGRQRNLLYKPTLDFLSVANDAYLCAINGKFEEADRLAKQTCDELIFVRLDLGWKARRADETIEVATPPAVVRRVVSRILDGAEHEVFEGSRAEVQSLEQRQRELRSACEAVLAALPPEGSESNA